MSSRNYETRVASITWVGALIVIVSTIIGYVEHPNDLEALMDYVRRGLGAAIAVVLGLVLTTFKRGR